MLNKSNSQYVCQPTAPLNIILPLHFYYRQKHQMHILEREKNSSHIGVRIYICLSVGEHAFAY